MKIYIYHIVFQKWTNQIKTKNVFKIIPYFASTYCIILLFGGFFTPEFADGFSLEFE